LMRRQPAASGPSAMFGCAPARVDAAPVDRPPRSRPTRPIASALLHRLAFQRAERHDPYRAKASRCVPSVSESYPTHVLPHRSPPQTDPDRTR
jgi:hypothetical protein